MRKSRIIAKMCRTVLTAVVGAVLLAGAVVQESYAAYTPEEYEMTDDGDYILTNEKKEEGCAVSLYMYANVSDNGIKTVRNQWCTTYVGPNDMAWLQYQFRPDNAKVVENLDGGEVWVWEFALENGDYKFSSPDGSVSYGSLPTIYTLNSDLSFPAYKEGYDPRYDTDSGVETRSVENETVRLYAMYGDRDWIEEHYSEFRDWAKEKESSISYVEENMTDAEALESGIVSVAGNENANDVLDEGDAELDSGETKTDIPIASDSQQESEKDGGIGGILIGVVAVAILAALGFGLGKKKK